VPKLSSVFFLAFAALATSVAVASDRPNILLILSDDQRCELGAYGSKVASTPNLDRFAASGVLFERAYCQFPLCNPSRSSMLTGLRPTTVGVLGNRTWFGAAHPDLVSLPKLFKDNGYHTYRSGKIFHGGIDDVEAWTDGAQERYFGEGATARPPRERGPRSSGETLSKTERSDRWIVIPGDGRNHGDHRVASRAIEYLKQASDKDEPFFLACGFSKPHSPPEAPQRFYDQFTLDDIELPIDFASKPTVPEGFPAGAIRPQNADLFVGREATPTAAKEMIRAYLASSSWMDFNAGRVLDELKELGLDENTIVVFWGDHGYQLGEKGKWSKAGSLWEQGVRTPLIVRNPGAKGNGKTAPIVVEALDIYPTLASLAGLTPSHTLEGRDLTPWLDNPNRPSERPAFSVWSEDGQHVTGIVVRTGRWRYAEFYGRGAGRMLIDAQADVAELKNLAESPQYASVVEELSRLVRDYVSPEKLATTR